MYIPEYLVVDILCFSSCISTPHCYFWLAMHVLETEVGLTVSRTSQRNFLNVERIISQLHQSWPLHREQNSAATRHSHNNSKCTTGSGRK